MIGEVLRIIRIANENISIKQAAEEIGFSGAYVSEVEKGNKKPSLKFLKAICTFYNIPMSKLFELTEFYDLCEKDPFQHTLIKTLEYYVDDYKYIDDKETDIKEKKTSKSY